MIKNYFCVLVCGGRNYNDAVHVAHVLETLQEKTKPDQMVIVNGAAPGADHQATNWAKTNGVRCIEVPAAWRFYGDKAGPMRNDWMLELFDVDLVIAFPGWVGTADMVRKANTRKIPVLEIEARKDA